MARKRGRPRRLFYHPFEDTSGAVFTKGFWAPVGSEGPTARSGQAAPARDCGTDTKQGGQRDEALRNNEEKRALGKRPAETALTMQKTVVFEAAAAEEGVEGVQGLLPLDRLRARPVYVGSALRRQHVRVRHFRELPVPM